MGLLSLSSPFEDGAKRATPVSYREPRSLTASAVRVNLTKKNEVEALKKRRDSGQWQNDSWDYYDLIGEIKYAAGLVAAVTSRVRLYPGWVTSGDMTPSNMFDIEDLPEDFKEDARNIITLLETGNGGTAGLLRDAALNLFVAGECYLVKEPPVDAFGLDVWQIRSVDEVITIQGRGSTEKVVIKENRNARPEEYKELPTDPFVGRIWRTHPRFSGEADSSLRGILELCDQLLLYSRMTRAVTKSRLNAGMLFIPEELSNIAQGDGEDGVDDPEMITPDAGDESDSFEEELIDSMTTPIADESSASAVVPLILRGPADLGDKIRHITLERSYDDKIAQDAERTLDRILAALDLPKDVVAGMASVKYSNAITIEESLYKAHIEPLVLMLCDALTIVFFRNFLRNLGHPEDLIQRAVIWYDPSAITTKPDKATSATTGYELGVLNAEAWRRAHGFSESDAPSGVEIIQRLAKEKGLLSEPVTEAALRSFAPELFDRIRREQETMSEPGALEAVQDAADGVIDEPRDTEETSASDDQPPTGLIEP